MLDLSVIILTYNEEIHICRCLENIIPIAKKIFIVDSFSTDNTLKIASEYKQVQIYQNKWPGNQALQFNWALDNLPIQTNWILRLDADEYLTPELIYEMDNKLPSLGTSVSAVVLPLGRAFMGRILKHGIVTGIEMIRLFRKGKARYEYRLMDEHLSISEGDIISFSNKFVDDNRMPIAHFINKHNGYSSREAALLLDAEYHLIDYFEGDSSQYCEYVRQKRMQKQKYARYPLFWRAFGYFLYRYIVKLGFLDGKEGFLWDFLQGWWYRTLVDAKIFEIKRICGNDKDKIRSYLKAQYNISLDSMN